MEILLVTSVSPLSPSCKTVYTASENLSWNQFKLFLYSARLQIFLPCTAVPAVKGLQTVCKDAPPQTLPVHQRSSSHRFTIALVPQPLSAEDRKINTKARLSSTVGARHARGLEKWAQGEGPSWGWKIHPEVGERNKIHGKSLFKKCYE